jgi:hypothetical protein
METKTKSKVSVETIIQFIEEYRDLEKAKYQVGYDLIRFALTGSNQALYQHLCGHWKSKKKSFDAFFTNLGYKNQIKILNYWGIHDDADLAYLELERKEISSYKEFRAIYASPPATVKACFDLLVFFYNHGIESFRPYKFQSGLTLPYQPSEKKRFGNSQNWGDFILSLKDPAFVINQILWPMQGGTHVHHRPSGEDWVLLGANYKTGQVCVKGWPATMAKISDCDFIEHGQPLEAGEIEYRTKQFPGEWQ